MREIEGGKWKERDRERKRRWTEKGIERRYGGGERRRAREENEKEENEKERG